MSLGTLFCVRLHLVLQIINLVPEPWSLCGDTRIHIDLTRIVWLGNLVLDDTWGKFASLPLM